MVTMGLRNFNLPNLGRKTYLVIGVVLLLIGTSVYLEIPEFLYPSDSEKAVNIADKNDFISNYKQESGAEDASTSKIPESRAQVLRETGEIPEDSSDNIYIVDYTSDDGTGVSAYVDVNRERVVDNKYNVAVN